MTETMTKLVVDCATGEQTIVPLTPAEIADRELLAAELLAAEEARQAEAAAQAALKLSARQKLVAGEPLTAEEAELLIA